MQYGEFIACITESLIHHEMQDGLNYNQACDKVEDFLTKFIIVGEERVRAKESEQEEESDK